MIRASVTRMSRRENSSCSAASSPAASSDRRMPSGVKSPAREELLDLPVALSGRPAAGRWQRSSSPWRGDSTPEGIRRSLLAAGLEAALQEEFSRGSLWLPMPESSADTRHWTR